MRWRRSCLDDDSGGRQLKIADFFSMKKIHLDQVPTEHRCSPKGKYEMHRQHVSLALGGVKDGGPWAGGHPFDIELTHLFPGKCNYPLHSHAAQWEHYIFLSGHGILHSEGHDSVPVGPGDHAICQPGDAHQIENTGAVPLVYYVITDHHPADITSYPRTGKRFLKPEYRVVTTAEVDYYADEE
jgi:uncharacterized cupin superfamily protein